MALNLPPPPIQEDKISSFLWQEWFRQVRSYLVGSGGLISWASVSKTGASLVDIPTRDHNVLQSIQGGTSSEFYHLKNTEHTALTNSVQGTWTPVFTNLTVVNGTGGATYTGRYSRIGRTVFFNIQIVCTGTATTSSTVGSTYCTLPTAVGVSDGCDVINATSNVSVGSGGISSSTDTCYPAGWIATGNTICITGKYEV